MTFRELALWLSLVSMVTGCADDLDWTLINTGGRGIGTHFQWRNDRELWVSGGTTVFRRTDGAWEELDLCGELIGSEIVEFEGDDVWALCGDGFGGPQALVHYEGVEGSFEPLPFDGRVMLAVMEQGIVVAGESSLHRLEGGAWVAFAPAPPLEGGPASCTGRSESDLYCTLGFGGEVLHWNGSAWSPTGVLADGRPELRAGDIWLGAGRFVGGVYESLAGETERPLTAVAVVPPSTVIWGGGDTEGLYLWRGSANGGPSQYIGGAPGVASVSPGGTAGGSNRLYAIDAGTFLIMTSTTSLSGSGSGVWEGR